jgi:hypothetical protein
MSIPSIPIRRWALYGATIGATLLPLPLIFQFSAVLGDINFLTSPFSVSIMYLKLAVFMIPIAAITATAVGWIAVKRRLAGDKDARIVLVSAFGFGALPSLLLLAVSLVDGITITQAMNIFVGFGAVPAALALGSAFAILLSGAQKNRHSE